jgi:hypothetical protein
VDFDVLNLFCHYATMGTAGLQCGVAIRPTETASVHVTARGRGGVDVCSGSIDGGPVCCKRSHLPVQPVKFRYAVDQRPVIPAPAIDQLRATESPAAGGFQWTIQSFDRSRSATRRAISAGASSGIGNTELTLISPST